MATRNTDIAMGQDSRNVRDRVNGKLSLGQPGVVLATYTTTGAEAAGDFVKIATLPKGARPLVDRWRVSAETVGGTGSTVATLGTATDDDAFSASAVAIASAINSAVTPIAGLGAEYTALTADTAVYAKLGLSSGGYTSGNHRETLTGRTGVKLGTGFLPPAGAVRALVRSRRMALIRA